MIKKTLIATALLVSAGFVHAQQRSNPDTTPSNAPVTPSVFLPNATITEGFDSLATALGAGWTTRNNSQNPATTPPHNAGWTQGDGIQMVPMAGQAGGANSFAQASFATIPTQGNASNWLVSPVVQFGTGATLEFWTIKRQAPFDDSLEVRFSTTTGAVNVGTVSTDLGDFTNLAFTVNPTLAAPPANFSCPSNAVVATAGPTANVDNYPTGAWCRVTITGFPASGSGRIAFRHNTIDTGNNGANGTIIGVDTFSFVEGVQGAPIASVGAAVVDFNRQVTSSIASRTATISNTGTAALTVTAITAPTAPFSIGAGGTCTAVPFTLAPAASCTIVYNFSSAVEGQFQQLITVTSNGGNPTFTLRGQALASIQLPATSTIGGIALLTLVVGLGIFGLRRRG